MANIYVDPGSARNRVRITIVHGDNTALADLSQEEACEIVKGLCLNAGLRWRGRAPWER